MKNSRLKTIALVFGIPVFIGILVRILVFKEWLESPLRYYHMLYGLDMQTLMRMGKEFYEHSGTLSLWKLVIATGFALNKGSEWPEFIVTVQLIFGVLTALFTAYIALRLTGKRVLSAMAGIISGLYAPAIMYECAILKETGLLFYVTAVTAFVLFCRKNHFKTYHLILCGALLYSITLVRFYGVLWGILIFVWILAYLFRREKRNRINTSPDTLKKTFKAFCCMLAGALAVMVITFSVNYSWSKTFPEVLISVDYNLKFGTIDDPAAMHIPAEHEQLLKEKKPVLKEYLSSANVYFKKLTYIFKSFEIPENLNYYFIRDHLFSLNYLFGPLFLIPAAAAGIIMLLINRRFYRKESFLFIYLLSFIIPLCLFFPLGRYRLILLPVFSISAAYLFVLLYKGIADFIFNNGKIKLLIIPLILYGVFIKWGIPSEIIIRGSDFLSYGQALKIQKGDTPEVERCYRAALSLNPSSESTLYSLSKHLIKTSKFKENVAVLKPYYDNGLREQKILLDYAFSLMASGSPLEAEKILSESVGFIDFKSKSGFNYYYYLAQVKKALGKNKEAGEAYRKAVELIEDPKLKAVLEEDMKHLPAN